jgi:hypothetical protein
VTATRQSVIPVMLSKDQSGRPFSAHQASTKPASAAGNSSERTSRFQPRAEAIAAATGWQNHTIRGVISGALKKKLGLTVEATRTREVGPNKTGARGSATTYRIVT